VSLQPHMDSDGLNYFKNRLQNSQYFLEYGCGGSTVYACNEPHIRKVISVDTDPSWIEKIKNETLDKSSKLIINHIDLGEVGDWGAPKTTIKFRDFYKYPTTPWLNAKKLKVVPDTVLIDGRFRVACFLSSLLAARVGTTLIFDDYFDRPQYFVAEEFCSIELKVGRAAVFTKTKQFNIIDLTSELCKYTMIWD